MHQNNGHEMREKSTLSRWLGVGAAASAFVLVSSMGMTWGLPTSKIDKYLFGQGEVWSGEKIYQLAGATEKLDAGKAAVVGADVDVDPLAPAGDGERSLTATDEDVARIYLRYRLYTHQPDEMITMMALAGMRPGELKLDPRLYQYWCLFIYPVGALIKLCGVLGLIDVRSELVYYLDNPDEFGKFYVVARWYAAAWGAIGVVVVFAIATRLAREYGVRNAEGRMRNGEWRRRSPDAKRRCDKDGGIGAGATAGIMFAIMPVVVCMSHEGKPHLPGAVLMLIAVWFAMRCLEADAPAQAAPRGSRSWWGLCISCGAAVGMVLSSVPIVVLIPLVAWLRGKQGAAGGNWSWVIRAGKGIAVAVVVYFITNPYVLINVFVNRDVLRSNFGNSFAMYQMARIGEGFVRVLELTTEGATLPIAVLGVIGLAVGLRRAPRTTMVLVVPALVFLVQFVLIGAGKPGEYGRFGVFINAALAMGTATLLYCLGRPWQVLRRITAGLLIFLSGLNGYAYLQGFVDDSEARGSRNNIAEFFDCLRRDEATGRILTPLGTLAEPAPYCFPPMDFAHLDLSLVPVGECVGSSAKEERLVVAPLERSGALRPKLANVRFALAEAWKNDRRFDERLANSLVFKNTDSVWRFHHGALGFDRLRRLMDQDTPISLANKPFFDSLHHDLDDASAIPLGR